MESTTERSAVSVLVVDDEEADLLGLAAILEGAGFHVHRAKSGQEAAQAYVDQPIRVVVTDIVMSGGDGIFLLDALRQLSPSVKVVAVSGKGPAGLAAAAAMGAAATLTKPVDARELIDAVREAAGL